MNSQTKRIALGLGVILAGATAAGAFVYFGGWLGKPLTPREAVQVIPREATVTGFITTEPQIWAQLSQFGTPEMQKLLGQGLQNLQKDLIQKHSLNYEQDIQPWVGNIMWAIVPTTQTSSEPSLLLIIGIKDKLKASNFNDKLAKQPGYQSQKRDYQGVTIVEITTPDQTKFSSAVIGNQILLSNQQQTIEKSIDVYKGKPSYGQKAGVQEAVTQKFSFKAPLTQVYIIPDYASLIQPFIIAGQVPPANLKQLSKVKFVVAGVGIVEQGLHLQTFARIDPTLIQSWVKPLANKTISLVPENTLAFANGQGISETWNQFVAESSNNPESKSLVALVRDTFKQVSLDADRDVFNWMNGEVAVGIIPTGPTTLPNLGMGGVILWQTSDQKTAQNTLNKLNLIAGQKGLFAVKQNNIQGKDVTEWTTYPMQQVVLSYAWLDNNSLAMTIGTPLTPIINTQSAHSLTTNDNFKTLIATFPKQNLGYGYLDVQQVWSKAVPLIQMSGNYISPEVTTFFNSIKGVATTASLPEPTLSQLDLILALKSTNAPP